MRLILVQFYIYITICTRINRKVYLNQGLFGCPKIQTGSSFFAPTKVLNKIAKIVDLLDLYRPLQTLTNPDNR